MNDLVIMKSRKALTTSLKVAATFSKEHKNVLQSIRNLTAENSAVKKMFAESTYVNDRGQEQPMYYMNRDGFTLLAMGFTGRDAIKFKLEYIEAFNRKEFSIPRYDSLQKQYFEKAMEFTRNWYPDFVLQREIQNANAQTSLKI